MFVSIGNGIAGIRGLSALGHPSVETHNHDYYIALDAPSYLAKYDHIVYIGEKTSCSPPSWWKFLASSLFLRPAGLLVASLVLSAGTVDYQPLVLGVTDALPDTFAYESTTDLSGSQSWVLSHVLSNQLHLRHAVGYLLCRLVAGSRVYLPSGGRKWELFWCCLHQSGIPDGKETILPLFVQLPPQ